ncbi:MULTISPECIES: glycosyltransferase family 4 protein [Metabacillus]|uniref:Glycosyl transferase n=2 Tax=Metabacillus TaxID=2675233 RepID=A0A179STB0_9BACI|nr:glycosyltransferase family 4 protein [Metabacillus litoralis]OAS84624.1 glycosyl transferase [Metabacillus litoralis]
MKILLATFWPVPHVGGVWNYMQQLKAKLESLGNEVDLLGYGEGNNYVHIVNENRKIEKIKLLPNVNAKLNARNNWSLYLNTDPFVNYYEFYRYLFEEGVTNLGLEKYDLIHTQDVISTVCINRIRPRRTALVASIHGCVAHEIKHSVTQDHKSPTAHLACLYMDKLEHDGATSAEVTIVANEWLKNILTSEFYVPNEQLKVHHYGYDTEAFLNRMKEKSPIQRPADKKVIIYAGRLTETKGVHHLLSALSQLQSIRNDWVCWIVGDGVKLAELQNQCKTLKLENKVSFFGNRNDVPYLLSISDIFVLPSLIENQPLSVIEAQIAGKAVIISDAGGLPEMVEHGMTGVITPAGDPAMLCININYLLEHDSYRENLGLRAQKWGMDYWSMDKAFQNVLEVYKSAISKKNF